MRKTIRTPLQDAWENAGRELGQETPTQGQRLSDGPLEAPMVLSEELEADPSWATAP